MVWIELDQYRYRWRALVNEVMNLRFPLYVGFLDWQIIGYILKKDTATGNM